MSNSEHCFTDAARGSASRSVNAEGSLLARMHSYSFGFGGLSSVVFIIWIISFVPSIR